MRLRIGRVDRHRRRWGGLVFSLLVPLTLGGFGGRRIGGSDRRGRLAMYLRGAWKTNIDIDIPECDGRAKMPSEEPVKDVNGVKEAFA